MARFIGEEVELVRISPPDHQQVMEHTEVQGAYLFPEMGYLLD